MRNNSSDSPLVVISHLRWDWVWQRPQHLVSRLASDRPVFYVEEPVATPTCPAPRIVSQPAGPVVRVWLEVPGTGTVLFGADRAGSYATLLSTWLEERQQTRCDVWLYTPMALEIAEALGPELLVYDVMDDLASFKGAPTGLQLLQRRLLERADVVFTGGRSLHRGVVSRRPHGTYLFPSGVETQHYAQSRGLRTEHDIPVAGYVGVIDERLDLDLVAAVADELPDWEIRLAGPVTKIDESSLPQRPNILYLGMQPYELLPEVMAGFDVALMPFALNEATRAISPTKTLEYLAAGLPVVSTRVPDVVADFGALVHLVDTGPELAEACRHVLTHSGDARDRKAAPTQQRHEWDTIAAEMAQILTTWREPQANESQRPEESA
ncbi:MAG TPA: glycosyltransferase [Mycobacteriales bacterium]|nr:glycosyltransferase [Mycobacteriales bacterium]